MIRGGGANRLRVVTWTLDPNELRRCRELAGLTPTQAAKKVGLTRMTIYRHEDPHRAPATVHDESVERYEVAYQTPADRFGRKHGDVRLAVPSLPAADVDGVPVLTAAELRKCRAAPQLYAGRRYVIEGNLLQYGDVPPSVADALRAEVGAAVRFRILSDAAEVVDATVFTRAASHAQALLDRAESRVPVAVTISVVSPNVEGFRGFPFFRGKPGKSAFAFVVDDVSDQTRTRT